jgi:predicted nucleic acid-binding protein
MGIVNDIGTGPIGLDTCVFIYFIEESKEFLNLVQPLFQAIDEGSLVAVTSGITLIETLVIPLRKGDTKLAMDYERILTNSRGLQLYELDCELLRQGAFLRANFGIKTPDALQIAASKRGKCSAFITNDRRLPKIEGLPILQLSDYLIPPTKEKRKRGKSIEFD